jgi:arsenite methyltransferase
LSDAPRRPDYGLDAPGVVRNLALGAFAGFALAGASFAGWLPRALHWRPAPQVAIEFPLDLLGLFTGIGFAATALWMWTASRRGKLTEREELLNRIAWRGDERVLDVGCGRGLLLVAAARRVPRGAAVGIDLWQKEDLSGNRPEVPLENAALEGVRERVAVETGDMRRMPFPDASFDLAVSRAAIHNLYRAPERAEAIREIARVLKPGGSALIRDIRHFGDYARAFSASGCTVRRLDSPFASALCTLVTFGSLRPHTLLARKGD